MTENDLVELEKVAHLNREVTVSRNRLLELCKTIRDAWARESRIRDILGEKA